MSSTRLRVAAAVAASSGLALATFGASTSLAAVTATTPATTPSSITVTEKCGEYPYVTTGGPSFVQAKFTVNVPSTLRPGQSIAANPSLSISGGVAHYGPNGTSTPKSFRILDGGGLTVGFAGTSASNVGYTFTQSPIIPVSASEQPNYFDTSLTTATPAPVVTASAGGTVTLSVSGFFLEVESFTSDDGTGPSTKTEFRCQLLSSGPSATIATVPVAGDPVATPTPTITPTPTATPTPTSTPTPTPVYDPLAPFVSEVYGQGYAYIGGLMVLIGERFDGLTKVTVGGTQAKVLLQIGKYIIALAPPKTPGFQPVNVYTKDHGINVGFPSPEYIYVSLW